MGYLPKAKDKEAQDKYADKAKKRRKLLGKLKLDRHHKMERFTVIIGTLTVCLTLNLAVSGFHAYENTKQILSDQAVYTTTANFSKTGTEVSINGVYRSSDNKTAFVVYKLDSLNSLSMDGKTYNVFVLGYKDAVHSQTMTGKYFVFGSTGLMGVMLYDQNGLPNQLLDIVVRANKTITPTVASNTENTDASFTKYNQMRLYANPGAKDAKKMSELGLKIDKEMLYYLFIGKEKEQEVLKFWKESVKKEKLLRSQISEYETRIQSAGFEKPKAPEWVKRGFILPDGFVMEDDYTLNPTKGNTSYIEAWFDGDLDRYLSKEASIKTNQETQYGLVSSSFGVDPVLVGKNGQSLDTTTIADGEDESMRVQVMRDYQALQNCWMELLSVKQQQQYQIPMQLLKIESIQKEQAAHFSWGDVKQVYVQHGK